MKKSSIQYCMPVENMKLVCKCTAKQLSMGKIEIRQEQKSQASRSWNEIKNPHRLSYNLDISSPPPYMQVLLIKIKLTTEKK